MWSGNLLSELSKDQQRGDIRSKGGMRFPRIPHPEGCDFLGVSRKFYPGGCEIGRMRFPVTPALAGPIIRHCNYIHDHTRRDFFTADLRVRVQNYHRFIDVGLAHR